MKTVIAPATRWIATLTLILSANISVAADTISVDTLASQIDQGKAPMVIDVRTENEYLAGHLPNARLIPYTQMPDYADNLSSLKEQPLVLYCRSGKRAGIAAETLEKAGFKGVLILEGSYEAWRTAGKKTVK